MSWLPCATLPECEFHTRLTDAVLRNTLSPDLRRWVCDRPRAFALCPFRYWMERPTLNDLADAIACGDIQVVETRVVFETCEITVPRARGAWVLEIVWAAMMRFPEATRPVRFVTYWTAYARGEPLGYRRTLEEYGLDDETPLVVGPHVASVQW